jgi:Glycosyl hydrolase family 79, N-terminal domain
MGPCPGMSWPTLATWFPAFLNATRESVLDVAVYHSYNQITPQQLYLNFSIPSGNLSAQQGPSPGGTGWQAQAMQQFVQHNAATTTPLWLGEMGPHNGGGGPGNISKSFASSFGYMDTLGSLARLGHQVVSRQTLVGGKYELLRCSTGGQVGCDFEPHPDYYVALLWSRFMGTKVLSPPVFEAVNHQGGWANDLHLHLHCSNNFHGKTFRAGSITLAFSNKNPDTSYFLSIPYWGPSRNEYLLEACADKDSNQNPFDAEKVQLNGKCLYLGDNASQVLIKILMGKHVSLDGRSLFKIPPASLGFVVFPQAKLLQCGAGSANEHLTKLE